MYKSSFHIKDMDCPSEENLIRLKLGELNNIRQLSFDLSKRVVDVYHLDDNTDIVDALNSLNLGAELVNSEEFPEAEIDGQNTQRKMLWTVLIINFSFFVLEMSTGLISKSMGLVADSLDMLADSFVYGLSLLAVGGTLVLKKKIAKTAGYFQILLASIGFLEVIRRFVSNENLPLFETMIGVSILALIANGLCLYILQKANSNEAHIQASMIFTSNDVIINLGVIIAGLLVMWTGSNKPDLIVGMIVFILVIKGAFRILSLSK